MNNLYFKKSVLLTLPLLIVLLSFLFSSCSDNDSLSTGENTNYSTLNNEEYSESTTLEEAKENSVIYITICDNDTVLKAKLKNNSSAEALLQMLEKNPITIELNDYGNFEKVGSLGSELPRNDSYITTKPGDLILYQGNQFSIYYDTNSWEFTKLGEIINTDKDELLSLLGQESVSVILSADYPSDK